MHELIYTVAETAAVLKTSKPTIYKLIDEGKLTAIKIGSLKIPKEELERFVNELYRNEQGDA